MAAWQGGKGPGLPSQTPLLAARPPSQQPQGNELQGAATRPRFGYKKLSIYRMDCPSVTHPAISSYWGILMTLETAIFMDGHLWIILNNITLL